MGEHVAAHVLGPHRLDDGTGHRGGDGVPAERRAVHVEPHGRVADRLHQRCPGDHAPEGQIRTRDPLGEGDHVGHDVVADAAEEVPEPTEAVDHLVGDEEHAVGVADATELLPVAGRRHQRAPTVLHRLGEHGRDRLGPFGQDHLLDGHHRGQRARITALGHLVAVGVGDPTHAVPQHRPERLGELGDAGDREGAEGRAVVRPFPGDHLVAPLVSPTEVVVAGELERRLHRLGTGTHEEDLGEVAGRLLGDHRRGPGGRLVRDPPGRIEGEGVHLRVRGGAQVASPVAEVGAEEAGEPVEMGVAVGVVDVAALAPGDHEKVGAPPGPTAGEARDQVRLGVRPRLVHPAPRDAPTSTTALP